MKFRVTVEATADDGKVAMRSSEFVMQGDSALGEARAQALRIMVSRYAILATRKLQEGAAALQKAS